MYSGTARTATEPDAPINKLLIRNFSVTSAPAPVGPCSCRLGIFQLYILVQRFVLLTAEWESSIKRVVDDERALLISATWVLSEWNPFATVRMIISRSIITSIGSSCLYTETDQTPEQSVLLMASMMVVAPSTRTTFWSITSLTLIFKADIHSLASIYFVTLLHDYGSPSKSPAHYKCKTSDQMPRADYCERIGLTFS